MSSAQTTMPRKAQPAKSSHTVVCLLLLRLVVDVASDDIGNVRTPQPGRALAGCCLLPTPSPCADVFEDLRLAAWGVRRQRDAGALEIGGKAGLRLDEALIGTLDCREKCLCEGFCQRRLGRGTESRGRSKLGRGGGGTHVMHGRSHMTIDPRIPTAVVPRWSTSDIHRPGRHCSHHALSAVRCWASRMMGELHSTKTPWKKLIVLGCMWRLSDRVMGIPYTYLVGTLPIYLVHTT